VEFALIVVWIVIGSSAAWVGHSLFAPAHREPIAIHLSIGGLGGFTGGYVVDAYERARHGAGFFLSFLFAGVAALALLALWRLVVRNVGTVGGTS
jgi:uncharacterized membrane protein YeaQ/YmgE (transglycosylase-associated protein family)